MEKLTFVALRSTITRPCTYNPEWEAFGGSLAQGPDVIPPFVEERVEEGRIGQLRNTSGAGEYGTYTVADLSTSCSG